MPGNLRGELSHDVHGVAGADAGRALALRSRTKDSRGTATGWSAWSSTRSARTSEKGTISPWLLRTNHWSMSVGLRAIGRVALDIDALDPAAVDEVVDVAAAPGGRDGVVDVGGAETERGDALLVDVDLEAGDVGQLAEADRGELADRRSRRRAAGRARRRSLSRPCRRCSAAPS